MLPDKFSLKVVGVTFVPGYPDNLNRLDLIAAKRYLYSGLMEEPLPAVLIRNPDNAHDANAVEVHVPAVGQIGHVPAGLAARLAPEMDAGERFQGSVVSVLVHPDDPTRPGISIEVDRVAALAVNPDLLVDDGLDPARFGDTDHLGRVAE